MNVVFVLLTAVSAGGQSAQGTAPAAAPAHAYPAPVHAAPVTSGCCGGCGAISSCCTADCCEKPGFFDRLRGMFRRNDCCESSCCPQPCCQPAPCCDTVSSCAPPCCDHCCDRPSLFERLRARFRKHDDCCAPSCCDTGCGTGCCGTGVPHAPAMHPPGTMPAPGARQPERLKMPKGEDGKGKADEGKAAQPDQKKDAKPDEKKEEGQLGNQSTTARPLTTTGPRIETENKHPFESGRRYEQRMSRAADYSRLTGQLYFVHADGGLWVLRYAPLSEEGANGGSVVLARDRRMDSYREGDLVTVQGRVISEKGSPRLGGALYQMHSIRLVDRPQR